VAAGDGIITCTHAPWPTIFRSADLCGDRLRQHEPAPGRRGGGPHAGRVPRSACSVWWCSSSWSGYLHKLQGCLCEVAEEAV